MRQLYPIARKSEHLGELTYTLPLAGHRAEPVWGSSIADAQARIDVARECGARSVRWSRNENADVIVDADSLRDLGE